MSSNRISSQAMKKTIAVAGFTALGFAAAHSAWSRGASPYLPLNLAPEIERKIERVLVLGDKPVMRKPIAAAIVLDALPKACEIDAALCEEVRAYLRGYMQDVNATELRGTLTLPKGSSKKIIPNQHGMTVDSSWNAVVATHYTFNDYILLNAGTVANQDDINATGSYLSAGFSWAQLDVGFRDHWFSPASDSSTLISTEAPTMPSITLSNYEPIGALGLSYEVFLARMSRQDISNLGIVTPGNPHLAGLQLTTEPVQGYALSVNRIFQYGGGTRSAGASQFVDALFKNSNKSDSATGEEFGNQAASITSSVIFPGRVPMAVHLEYAGDDNAYEGPYRLGVTNMTVGLDFPKLWNRFDLTFEVSEWQQAWYQHHIYHSGLTNEGVVIGHWFGDSKVFTDQVFGSSESIALGMQTGSRGYLRARYRTLANASYSPYPYERSHELDLNYATSWRDHPIGADLYVGRDVFGESFWRLSISFDLAKMPQSFGSSLPEESSGGEKAEYFVESGVNYTSAFERLSYYIHNRSNYRAAYHLGLGARRHVSEHNDLGVRLEFDDVNQHSLISLRAIDYRYRFNRHVALNAFFGFSRYEIFSLPAYGYYWGGGLQWMNLIRGWDLSADYRMNDKLTRTKVLTTDPQQTVLGGIYVDTRGTAVYLSHRF